MKISIEMPLAHMVLVHVKESAPTNLFVFKDDYSNLNNTDATNAVEDGPQGFTRKLALMELTTYGKTYMMLVQTQH